MLDTSFNLEGVDELQAKLKQLKELPQQKSARFALRKAANIVRDAAKANAERIDNPETPDRIPDNIVVRYDGQYTRATGDMKMSVGVLGGAGMRKSAVKAPGGNTWYWRYIEFGRGPISIKKGVLVNSQTGQFFGKSVAAAKAQPFMRPALSSNIDAATDEFLQQFDKALVRAIRRANRGR